MRTRLLVAAALSLGAAAGPGAQAADKVKIGFVSTLSGPSAALELYLSKFSGLLKNRSTVTQNGPAFLERTLRQTSCSLAMSQLGLRAPALRSSHSVRTSSSGSSSSTT